MYIKNTADVKPKKHQHCFISGYEGGNLLEFNNNSANVAGNDLYGGDFYMCTIECYSCNPNQAPSSSAMSEIIFLQVTTQLM